MNIKKRNIQLQEYRGFNRNKYKKRHAALVACMSGNIHKKPNVSGHHTRGSAKNLPQRHTKTSGKMCGHNPTGYISSKVRNNKQFIWSVSGMFAEI